MSIAEEIRARIAAAMPPLELEIIDQSEDHRGHGGWREGGETHFHMRLTSKAFQGLSRIERQRLVHKALGNLLAAKIHALSMDLHAPDEV